MERMLIAVDETLSVHLLAVKGPAIESEVDELGLRAENLGLDAVCDRPGLHVYSCAPVWEAGAEPTSGSMAYDRDGELRALTPAEWDLVQAGNFSGLLASWTDVRSSDAWEPEAQSAPANGPHGSLLPPS